MMNLMERQLYDRLLAEREVRFRYRKGNGEIRDARGTCNLEFVPFEKHPERHLPITTSIRYYDWDRKEWRSFRLGTLMEML